MHDDLVAAASAPVSVGAADTSLEPSGAQAAIDFTNDVCRLRPRPRARRGRRGRRARPLGTAYALSNEQPAWRDAARQIDAGVLLTAPPSICQYSVTPHAGCSFDSA